MDRFDDKMNKLLLLTQYEDKKWSRKRNIYLFHVNLECSQVSTFMNSPKIGKRLPMAYGGIT